jgi:hypothetical protein
MPNTVHIAGRGSVVRQLRILASQFSAGRQDRAPNSATKFSTNRWRSYYATKKTF